MTDTTMDLTQALEALQAEVRHLAARLSKLESNGLNTAEAPAPPIAGNHAQSPVAAQATTIEQPQEALTEELMLVLSAAVATFLGERAHVRQIRLLGSERWSMQGRVSIQASHYLHNG